MTIHNSTKSEHVSTMSNRIVKHDSCCRHSESMQYTTQPHLQTVLQHEKHSSCFDALARQLGTDTMSARFAVRIFIDHKTIS